MELIKILTSEEREEHTDRRGDRWAIFRCPECEELIARPKHNGIKQKRCGDCRAKHGNFGTKHAMTGTALYTSWRNMKRRCQGKGNKYKTYVEKGITYPDSWETFDGFYADMGATYKEGLTLDREDNDKSYSADNCQWITMELNRVKDKVKAIRQLDSKGVELAVWASSHEAARALYPNLEIKDQRARANAMARVARGERKTYLSEVWEYV